MNLKMNVDAIKEKQFPKRTERVCKPLVLDLFTTSIIVFSLQLEVGLLWLLAYYTSGFLKSLSFVLYHKDIDNMIVHSFSSR